MAERETRLEMATQHVLEARKIVERPRLIIERKKQAGVDASVSEDLLRTFEVSLTTFEGDLAAIVAGIKL